MWKNALSGAALLAADACSLQQIRTTFILRRKYPAPLHKKGASPKKLRSRSFIYELVKNEAVERQPDIDVILTSYVEGLGNSGEKISVRPHYAYNNLLLPGLAVYASPENLTKYANFISKAETKEYSSVYASRTIKTLSSMYLSVVMNKDQPWTIQPWHIRTSFRKCGYRVPEEAITLPGAPIKGPDPSLEDKEFYVTVTINKTEKVNVRCRVHHWATEVVDRIPHVEKFWENPSEPVHEEFQKALSQMPSKAVVEQNSV